MTFGSPAAAIAAVLSLGLASPVAAQPLASKTWHADWGVDTCTLRRLPDDSNGSVLKLRHIPGTDAFHLLVINRSWPIRKAGDAPNVELMLDTGGVVPAKASYSRDSFVEEAALWLRVDGRDLPARLAAARTLTVRDGERLIATFSLPHVAAATKALQACVKDALAQWGIDADAWSRLRSAPKPKMPLASLVGDGDYPGDAIRNHESGQVVARLSIDATGKPVACDVVVSSKHASLDRKTCAIFLRKAKFEPAIDGEGTAVAAPYVTTLGWFLPG